MRSRRGVAAACVVCLLAIVAPAYAEPPPSEARRTVGQQMRKVFAARLRRDVGLDDAQVRAVVPKIEAMERERGQLLRDRLRLLRELRRDLDAGAPDAELARRLDRIDRASQDADRVARAGLAEIDRSLTVPQRARLRLLLVHFRDEMTRRIQDVRSGPHEAPSSAPRDR